jgi:hypothetical protein
MKLVIPALAAALALAACEGDSATTSSSAPDVARSPDAAQTSDAASAASDASPTRPETGGVDPRPDPCTRTGWEPEGLVAAQATGENDALDYAYLESYLTNPTSETDPLTVLYLEFYYGYGAKAGPQTITFTGENYVDCAVCGVIYADCDADGACARTFLVDSGTLEVTANDGKSGQLAGVLRDARFVEVEINDDFESTPVEGGQTWCVDAYAFDAALEYVPAAAE